jgi:hypothetical protein
MKSMAVFAVIEQKTTRCFDCRCLPTHAVEKWVSAA